MYSLGQLGRALANAEPEMARMIDQFSRAMSLLKMWAQQHPYDALGPETRTLIDEVQAPHQSRSVEP